MTKQEHQPFPRFWPELAESEQRTAGIHLPPWHLLEAEAASLRAQFAANPEQWDPVRSPYMRRFGNADFHRRAEAFDLKNLQCFQYLPSVEAWKLTTAQQLASLHLRAGSSLDDVNRMVNQSHAELAHLLYHQSLWRHFGRHIYVLDPTTYTLLAYTPLPDIPASVLSAPYHSFYLKLPKDAFQFEVENPYLEQRLRIERGVTREQAWRDSLETAPVEGLMVALDELDPDFPGTRELAITVVSEGRNSEDRNVAFISGRIGPDAKLSDIDFSSEESTQFFYGVTGDVAHRPFSDTNPVYANPNRKGASDLAFAVPRAVLGFLLYLASEHPSVEPIAPAPFRQFKEIRSQKQRDAALGGQESRLRGVTRLPILYVGRREALEHQAALVSAEQAARLEGKKWTLQHQVWVRGHWRNQPYGEGRVFRRLKWIRPFLRGPDMAESVATHAAKVQTAAPATAAEERRVS